MRRYLLASFILVAGCATRPETPLPVVQQPVPVTPVPRAPTQLAGLTIHEVVQHFGRPALQIQEGNSLKLQFRNSYCVLDAYFYPSTGNFLAFVANLGSRGLLQEALASFRRNAEFPSEGVAAPAFIPGVDWSDHWSFWQESYPALMVTDTAPYRYPHYHTLQDTPDKLDYERLARVVKGLHGMLRDLARAPPRR